MTRASLLLAMLVGACGDTAAPAHHDAPSHVDNPVAEQALTLVRLTPEAVARLRIERAEVYVEEAAEVRRVSAEVIVPPGRVLSVSAPVAGVVRVVREVVPGQGVEAGDELLRLVPLASVDRDTRARANREVEVAQANLAAAEARHTRTQALAEGRAGSQRAIEEANAAQEVARADLDAAQARVRAMRNAPLLSDVSMRVRAPESGVLRSIGFASGQVLAAGAPLFEIVVTDELWLRAPVAWQGRHAVARG